MGNQMVWHDRFNIGVDIIDKEHKKLFSVMNRLLAFSEEEMKSQWVCQEGIKYFKGHAMKHFSEEEAYMASIEYAGYKTHRRIHDYFRLNTLPALEQELETTNYSPDSVKHFLGVCAGWLIGHTLTEDRAITGKVMSKWGDLMPNEEQAALERTIIELHRDIFQLTPRVISEHYGGEKFGKGIYYRLSYVTEEGKKWEVMLVFEEKLLLNTMGVLLGEKKDKVNVMLVNATRYMARLFVDRIHAYFPSSGEIKMKEENLLTYDQFYRIFERQHPQSSLLFDTGKGYFAFCVIAPHLLENKETTAIKAENAMSEIKKYLRDNQGNKKKKILVVDDSSVARQAMSDLLSKDYQVTLAQSGTSAIRCLTLNQPDLVLLDYEMPVCDGKQVLEMIRSEQEFAKIPVFFLTSRVDKEGVQKVMPLKPEGYLLKSLKPEEIKKNIDDYFVRRKK